MVTYENIEASASILGINTNDGRPVIGAIYISKNINFIKENSIEFFTLVFLHIGAIYISKNINFIKENSIEFFTLVFLHEITHLLVFSKTLFPYFSNIPNIKEEEINGIKRKIYF